MQKAVRWFIVIAALVPGVALASVPQDALVKAGGSAVYYYAVDGKRYVFPNEAIYKSWFIDFSNVVRVSDAELAAMPLGGNVTYRPGIRMLKILTDPKVYAVDRGGTLRWVKSPELAEELYGQYWNTAIDDLSDAFFLNYTIGAPIETNGNFAPLQVAEATDTINADMGLPVGPATRRSDTEVSNIVDGWRAFAFNHINQLRQQNGVGPLILNQLLNRIATIHSKDMAVNTKNLQHEGYLGETPDERMRDGKVPDVLTRTFITIPHPEDFGWSGENIGYTTLWNFDNSVTRGITRLHELFLDEPPDEPNHRTTMLSTLHPYSEVGVGPYVDTEGKLWLTEDYISP